MPRQARLDAPGTLHHVLIRGIEKEVRSGNQSRKAAKVRAEIACFLNREMGISMAEIARKLGVGASAVAMAIKRKNP